MCSEVRMEGACERRSVKWGWIPTITPAGEPVCEGFLEGRPDPRLTARLPASNRSATPPPRGERIRYRMPATPAALNMASEQQMRLPTLGMRAIRLTAPDYHRDPGRVWFSISG